MKIDTSELDRSLERLKEIRKDFKKRLDKYSEKSPVSTEAILELLNDNMTDLNDTDCEEYFDELENDAERLDHLIAISNQCKLFASDNERRSQEYRQSADLWERRLQKIQGYGIRLLNKQPMKSLENDDYIAGLDRNIFEVKCGLTRKYSTQNMIPDELIFSIPEAYRQPKIIWEMRADLVRDTLISGKKLNFAKLIDKQRLRIINKSEENYEP